MARYSDKELRYIERRLVDSDYALTHAPFDVIKSYRDAQGSGSVGIAYVKRWGWYVLVTAGQGPVVIYPKEE